MGPLPRTHGLLGAMLESRSPTARPTSAPTRAFAAGGRPSIRGWPHSWACPSPRAARSSSRTPTTSAPTTSGSSSCSPPTPRSPSRPPASTSAPGSSARSRSATGSPAISTIRWCRSSSASCSAPARPRRCSTRPRGRPGRRSSVLGDLAQEAVGELRSLIFQLRPVAIGADGLAAALTKHVEILRRGQTVPIALVTEGPPRLRPGAYDEVFKIAQEAITNALRHAGAARPGGRADRARGRPRPAGARRRHRLRPPGCGPAVALVAERYGILEGDGPRGRAGGDRRGAPGPARP